MPEEETMSSNTPQSGFSHEKIETNNFLMVVLILLVVAIGGLVEIVPLFFQKSTTEAVAGMQPPSSLQVLGRDVYVREGCYNCHSQMIRPFRAETLRYGHYSVAGEFVYDHPFQWGSKRTGPDLARVGGKYSNEWHVAHFKDPRAMSEGTVMPNFNLTSEQAQALSILMLSWKRNDVPARYVSGAPRTDPRSPEELEAEATMRTGPGGWFVQTGCFVCHSISVFGVKSPAQIGPDLSMAVEDVQSRFGVTLDQFLANPTGTMSVVLSRQIVLTPEQKQVAIQKLREAFAEYQRQRGAAAATAAAGGR
jgi:cytochrome c oxidase cbb3-type subunit 2